MNLESYFAPFRANIIGINQDFESPFGRQRIIYADWTASSRMFGPVERMLSEEIAPFVGNIHTDTSVTGTTMTRAYHEALHLLEIGAIGRRVHEWFNEFGTAGVVATEWEPMGLGYEI